MLNACVAIGCLVKDPNLMHSNANDPIALAVIYDYANTDGEWLADNIDCLAWSKLGEKGSKNFKKGGLLVIVDSIRNLIITPNGDTYTLQYVSDESV